MNDFPTPQLDHLAGLEIFYFLPVEDLSDIPDPVNYLISEDVELSSGKTWLKGYASAETLKFSEKSQPGKQGEFVRAEIAGFAPDSLEFHQVFAKMAGRKFVVKAKDNDGNMRLIGTLEQPLEFFPDFDTQTISKQKGHSFSFAGLLSYRSPYFQPPTITYNIYDDVVVREYDSRGFPVITDYYYQEKLLFTTNSVWNSAGIRISRKVVDGKSFLEYPF